MFSAARAHSRLHQAAAVALHNITVRVTDQQQLDGVLLYLGKHGQHVDSILLGVSENRDAAEPSLGLRELPPNLQLSSLQLLDLNLQLQPGHGFNGVLGAAAGSAALKRLTLSSSCTVCDELHLLDDAPADALAAALLQLPAGLEHLSICSVVQYGVGTPAVWVPLPTFFLQQLQQLTYLELAFNELRGAREGQLALQPLQRLTRLVDLRLTPFDPTTVLASMLSGTHNLTRLQLEGDRVGLDLRVESDVLAGKTQLQHLQLGWCTIMGGVAGAAQLLSHLQPLQQLTHVDLEHSEWEGHPTAAAFSALTASSKLQHLNISSCTLPAGVWQHVFPAARQLPHIQSLDVSGVRLPDRSPAPTPEGSRLVSCCRGLQSLKMQHLQYSAELLASLQGLSGLHTLRWDADPYSNAVGTLSTMPVEDLHMVCQLTGLQELSLAGFENETEELLQLTQLRQLTWLSCKGVLGDPLRFCFTQQVSSTMVNCPLACQLCLVAAALLAGCTGRYIWDPFWVGQQCCKVFASFHGICTSVGFCCAECCLFCIMLK
jgi:hypothetical protein